MGGQSVLSSNKSSTCPVSADLQTSPGASGLPVQTGLMDFQVPSESQDSPSDSRTQLKKRNVLSKEQTLVLEENFEKCKYVNKKQCTALTRRLGMTEKQIKTWFKNRRTRERQKKGQQLTGKIGSGPHNRLTYPGGGEVSDFAASLHSVCQRYLDDSCSPQSRLLSNSPHQESNLALIDQSLEEMGFIKSHVIGVHQKQKCRELPRKPGHLSSDRFGLSSVPSYPYGSPSADSMCERSSGLSFSPLLSPSNITQNTESTFAMCQTSSVLSPLPEHSHLSNSLDHMAIFSNTDQACEIYQKNRRSKKQRKKSEKAIVQIWKQDQDRCAKPQSTKGTVSLPSSACEDTLCERQSVFSSPSWRTSSTSPDSEPIFSTREGTSHVSFPPPFSPHMFSDLESTLSIDQTNENLLSDSLMSGQDDQDPATGESILALSSVHRISAQPTAAQDPAIAQTPHSSTALAAGNPRETSFLNTPALTEDVQDQPAMEDQLFLEQLSDLDAALDQGPLPDYFTEYFSLLDAI